MKPTHVIKWDRPKGRHKHNGIEYDTIKHPRYKYRLARDYTFKLGCFCMPFESDYIKVDHLGNCTIYIGYCWDGPSGPTIDTKTFMRGSLVHDCYYQLMRERHLKQSDRGVADQELKRICIEDGMCSFRAWYVYWAVHLFAGYAAKPKS